MLQPSFRMFLKEIGRTHRYPNRSQLILSLYHFDPRSDHPSVELNKFNWPRPAVVKMCDYHSFMLNEFLHTRLGRKGFDRSSKFMVCCPFCGPKKVLSSVSFKFHSFTHRVHVFIGDYIVSVTRNERGRIRIFYNYLHLLLKELAHLGLLSCNSRSCSKSNHPTL